MATDHITWSDLRRAPGDPRPPAALVVSIALPAQLAWAATVQSLDVPELLAGAGVVAIALVAAWRLTLPAATLMGILTFLVVDGFVQNRFGELGWDGAPDLALLVVLLVGCCLVAESRHDRIRHVRARSGSSPSRTT